MASLDNLSLQQLSRVIWRLLQLGDKLAPKISSLCVCVYCKISNYDPNYNVFADVWL